MSQFTTEDEALNRAIEESLRSERDREHGLEVKTTPEEEVEEEKVPEPLPQVTEQLLPKPINVLPKIATCCTQYGSTQAVKSTPIGYADSKLVNLRKRTNEKSLDHPQKPPDHPQKPPRPGMTLHTVIKNGWLAKEWR